LLFLFPLFTVLLNCPYLNPQVSACFFPFSSALQRGQGRLRGAFVTGHSQTITKRDCLHIAEVGQPVHTLLVHLLLSSPLLPMS